MEYRELILKPGDKLEEVVDLLISYEKLKYPKEKSIRVVFNGFEFYSDTVTMDDAFLKVTGMTKKEFDKYLYGE